MKRTQSGRIINRAGSRPAAVCALLFCATAALSQGALVAHYKLNETSGTSIADSSGNGLGGTLKTFKGTGGTLGTTSVSAGTYGAITVSATDAANFGTSIDFAQDANNTMGIDLGAPAAINNLCTTGATGGVGTFTVMSWAYLDNVTGTQVIMATGHGIDANGLTQPSGARGGWGFSASTTNLRYTTYGSTDNNVTVTPALAAGSWYHLALTFNNGVAQMFVNGTFAGEDTSLGTFRQENSVSYYIGSAVVGTTGSNPGGGGDYFLGRMDEIKVFNTVLTASEIQAAALPVPEPSTSVFGLVGAAFLLRRRRSR